MATIAELVQGRETYKVTADMTVLECAKFMAERNIGAVPVMRDGQLIGILSERDILKRVVAGARSPGTTQVSEVMTPRPYTVPITADLSDCMFLMREHGFRHLPVMDGDNIVGLISLRDMLLRDLTDKDDEVKMMRAYIQREGS